MKNVFRYLIFIITSIFFVSGCGKKENEVKPLIIRVAWVLPEGHPSSRAMKYFKSEVEKESGGTIEVRLFANGVLGNATACIESLSSGNIEMGVFSAAPLSQFVEEFNVLCMPFLFRDKMHEYNVIDGKTGLQLSGNLQKIGLKGLGYFDAGFRNVMTKKGPVSRPEDLEGQRIRVMSSRLMTDTVNALGASAIVMGQGEVYSALQTGVLDGWENNPATALTFRMHETGCRYFTWTRHLAVPDVVVINASFFGKLDNKQQRMILEAASKTVARQRVLWQEAESKAVDELKKAGMVFNEPEHELFENRVGELYARNYRKYGDGFKDICESIRGQQ